MRKNTKTLETGWSVVVASRPAVLQVTFLSGSLICSFVYIRTWYIVLMAIYFGVLLPAHIESSSPEEILESTFPFTPQSALEKPLSKRKLQDIYDDQDTNRPL